ncbi:MAG: porin family protein [Rikenellaceae bacterium]|nr:porin family protein [Rikenellaceae bacterium]
MKKLIFTILALGVTAGAFAQNTVDRIQDGSERTIDKMRAGTQKTVDKMQDGVQRNNARMRSAAYSPNSLKGGMALGASLNYGTDIKSLGIGIRYDYMISNSFRLTPNATFWIKNDDLSSWDINVDIQYLIPLAERFKIYPLAGFTVSHWKYDGNDNHDKWNDTYFGANLGAGIEYDVAPNWLVNFDLKYRIIKDHGQLVLGLGFAYRF